MKVNFLLISFVLLFVNFLCAQSRLKVLKHSHNDYEQKIPLQSALKHRFNSVEIDVFRLEDRLIVSHDGINLQDKPDIVELYFKHLDSIYQSEINQLIFLIDVKKSDPETFKILHFIIKKYDTYFYKRNEDNSEKVFQILLSGSFPKEEIIRDPSWAYFYVDGRFEDLNKAFDSEIMPWVSSSFKPFSNSLNPSKISRVNQDEIRSIVTKAHLQGKKVRFWATKDHPTMWKLLIDLKVDIIGVDHIEDFSTFLQSMN